MLAARGRCSHIVGMRYFRSLMLCLLAAALILLAGRAPVTQAADSTAWVEPPAISIKKISTATGSQSQPLFMSNLDCTLLSYRLVNDSTMRNGCFSPAAFGLVDTDSGHLIFNGTDEALQLASYTGRQVLVPWPNALNFLAADAAATGGSYLSMYKNPLSSIEDQRNYLGQLTGKRLNAPPELPLYDTQGNKLVVNLQTLAFSEGGSWMSAETLTGAFIRMNLATLDKLAFAPSFAQSGSPGMLNSSVALRDDGRVAAIANDTAASLKLYELSDCAPGLKYDLCKSRDYWSYLKQRLPGLYSVRSVRFVNDTLIKFEAWSTVSSESGTYLLAPSAQITSLTDYLALGDSYTSGEGAFNYRTETDTPDNRCHASVHAYPALLTRELFSAAGGHSVACSGAVLNDIGNRSMQYRGQVRGVADLEALQSKQAALLTSVLTNHLPGYIAQHHFLKQDQPRIVSVSIGGNDIGFGDIVASCVVPHATIHMSDNTCFNTYEDRLEVLEQIDRTVPRWSTLFSQLSKAAPGSNLYVIGYPDIISDRGSCDLNVQLNQSEREFARELVTYLNASIQKAALSAKVTYVDISDALVGHRLCEAARQNVAVNGITAGTDAGILGTDIIGSESFHPNALGHILIAQAILKKTDSFTSHQTAAEPPKTDSSKFLDKPKTNRVVRVRVPATVTTKKILYRQGGAQVVIDGPSVGLRSGNTYSIILGSTGQSLGTVTSGQDGSVEIVVTIPVNTPSGGTTVDLIGINQNGEQIVVTQPVFIGNSPDNTDGDVIPDAADSCPVLVNSGIDEDRDSLDDICDGAIGNAPAGTPEEQPASGTTSEGSTGVSGGLTLDASTAIGSSIPMPVTQNPALRIAANSGSIQSTGQYVPTVKQYSLQGGAPPGKLTTHRESQPSKLPPRLPLRYYQWILWLGLVIILWWLLLLCAQLGTYFARFWKRENRQLV
jgi:lysophospholipase L1-like esterase